MQRTSRVSKVFAAGTAVLVFATLFVASPAFARESAPAAQATGVSASSRVKIRVIVLERLDASSGLQKRVNHRSTAQRQLQTHNGQQLLTIAAL